MVNTYECKLCMYVTTEKSNLTRHMNSKKHITQQSRHLIKSSVHTDDNIKVTNDFECKFCTSIFTRIDSLTRHYKTCNIKNNKSIKTYKINKTQNDDLNATSSKEYIETNINMSPPHMLFNARQTVTKTPQNDLYICEFCNNSFSRNNNLTRHKKICVSKELSILKNKMEMEKYNTETENKIKMLQFDNDRYKKENQFIKAENDYHKQMLNEAGGLVKKSVSALTYVVHNYGSAPTIEMLDIHDMKDLEENNKKLVEDVISAYKHKTLDKYLGDSIIILYKKDKPEDQSVWSTDVSRLTYLIKELMVNNSSNWIIDKKGIKTREYLINPLLNHIKSLVVSYQKNNANVSTNITEIEYALEVNKQSFKLISDIDDEIIGNNLLKYISSHLFFNEKLLKS